MNITAKAVEEAERRYPKRTFVRDSYVQNAFVAGAEWASALPPESREALAQMLEEHPEPVYVPRLKSVERRAWRRSKKFAVDVIRGAS